MEQGQKYQICTRCVMDSSDPEIVFDAKGRCNHCTAAITRLEQSYLPDARGQRKLETMLEKIRQDGKGKPYDCLIGISGGIDSSWLTYKSKEWGLRPLIFHVDAGWNSEIAQQNIEQLLKHLNYTLYTHVVDWEEMRDLQRAYLESSLANQDVPQDHVFFAVLFQKAAELGIKYWLSGSNLVSESILPQAWGYTAMDSRQLKAVHKQFGKVPLRTYKTLSFFEYCKFYNEIPLFPSVKALAPLNWMDYSPEKARDVLAREVGWKYYGRKHSESRFTKFFQNYYLPEKFGYDKRRAHLSSLIAAGEITREQALETLKEPLYDQAELQSDREFFLKKLGYSEDEWSRVFSLPNKSFRDYPNWSNFLAMGRKVKRILRKMNLLG